MRSSKGILAALVCISVGLALPSLAQSRGGGPPPGGGIGGGGGMGGRPMGGPQFPGDGQPPQRPQPGDNRVGLQLGPPGQRWWDDRSYAKNLKLRPDQQTRMDAIFEQNRSTLVNRFEGLQQAENQMEELSSARVPDEAAIFAQIDRIAQARAELEKANTHMLLQIRKEMDPDQIKRLEKQH
jgi:Spy/CpxP family protein refolding chaperone